MSESLKPGLKKAPVQDIFDLEMRIYVSYQHSQLITADPALNPLVDQHFVHWNWQFGWHFRRPYFQPHPRSRIHKKKRTKWGHLRSKIFRQRDFLVQDAGLELCLSAETSCLVTPLVERLLGAGGDGVSQLFFCFSFMSLYVFYILYFPSFNWLVCLNDHGHCTYFHCLPLCG